MKVYNISEICKTLHFGRSKVLHMAKKGILPVTKVGKSYITTEEQLNRWLQENEGKEIFMD